jgi:class 3 adenylate cyclase
VERSEEIRRVVERLERAISDGDAESVLGRLSTDPGLLVIGSDPAEWWLGSDARRVWARQLEEFQDAFQVTVNEIEAWEEGNVGWASVRETVEFEGRTIDGRASYILHLEHGEWKLVQAHFSWPQRHVDVLGAAITTTLEELEQTVQRTRPDLSEALDSEGTVTIAFTDIVDSTVSLSRLGDRAWRDILRRHNAIVAQAVAAHGGRVVQTEGDGSMLAFASARRAVASAQEIQRRIRETFSDDETPIRVRIGVHTGDALNEVDGYFGQTVHYAARVAGNARGGEILVSSVVKQLVAGGGVAYGEGRDVALKGLDGVHRLYAVEAG